MDYFLVGRSLPKLHARVAQGFPRMQRAPAVGRRCSLRLQDLYSTDPSVLGYLKVALLHPWTFCGGGERTRGSEGMERMVSNRA